MKDFTPQQSKELIEYSLTIILACLAILSILYLLSAPMLETLSCL